MILRQLIPLISCLVALTALSACGNKGDLYLIPDPVSQEDMEQFQRVLAVEEVPVAEPTEVDDDDIYVKPGKKEAAQP